METGGIRGDEGVDKGQGGGGEAMGCIFTRGWGVFSWVFSSYLYIHSVLFCSVLAEKSNSRTRTPGGPKVLFKEK